MRVAVFGTGYAGLPLARTLERRLPDSVDLLVIDERDTHRLKHELHHLVRDPSIAEHLEIPLSELLERARHRAARVQSIDPSAGEATLADGETVAYDVGAISLGARTAVETIPDGPADALTLDSIADGLTIRERALAIDAGGRIVVAGAGLTGIQVAGELAELLADAAFDVELIEQQATVAPGFDESFQAAVREELQARDVYVRTGTAIADISSDRLELADGRTVDFDELVWAGGIAGSDALDRDRPVVQSTLRLDDRTFVLGDAARVVDADGTAVPATAQTATRQAKVAARNVTRVVEHRLDGQTGFEPRLDSYRYTPRGWAVSVGDGAVASVGPSVLRGPPARAVKTSIAAGHLASIGAVADALEHVTATYAPEY
jgi:NADH dehydrogenase